MNGAMKRDYKYWLALVGVLLLAVGLRFFKLGQVPVSLYWDEVAILVDAKTVAATGLDMHGHHWLQSLFVSYGDYKLPVYIWLASLAVKLVGVSEWAVRLPSALAGVGTVLLAGALTNELFEDKKNKRWLSVATMLVVAISPWSVMFSRTGFEGHLAQLWLGISIYLLLVARKKKILGYLSPLFGTLATYTYFSVRFVWPVVFLATSWLLFRKKPWKMVIFGVVFFSLSLLPMMRSPFYGASNLFRYNTTSILNDKANIELSNQYRQIAGNSLFNKAIYHRDLILGRELMANYGDFLSLDYLFVSGDPNLRHGTGQHGLFLFAFLPCLLLGLYTAFKKHSATAWLLVIWWLIALLPAAVPTDTPHALRSLNSLLPIASLIGLGVYELWMNKHKLVRVIFILWLSFNFAQFVHFYFIEYPTISAYEWQANYKELAEVIDEQRPQVSDIYIQVFDDRFYLWLFAYGSYSAEEIQQFEKNNYRITALPHIYFEQFHWTKLDSLDRKILVVGESKELAKHLADYEVKTTWDGQIGASTVRSAAYSVALLERQND